MIAPASESFYARPMRTGALLLAILISAAPLAQAGETEDFGVAASTTLRLADHAAPTPLGVPGAETITTEQVLHRISRPAVERPLLFDVIGETHNSLPGAIWLPDAGLGVSFDDPVQEQLAATLELIARGDKGRAMVFFCASERCWLSYNAALRAVRLGYTSVAWYRGGVRAWREAGLALGPMHYSWRRPELK